MIHGVLDQSHLLAGPRSRLVFTSPVLECKIGIDILRSLENPHMGSLTCGVRAVMVGKAKWEPLEVPLLRKTT